MPIKPTIPILALLLTTATLSAQQTSFQASCQRHVVLPGGFNAVTVVDGTLYCNTTGMLLKASRDGVDITALLPDTTLYAIAPDATFMVMHPSGDVYITTPDRKGRSTLMMLRTREGRKPKLTSVKMEGMSVEHPTFSADGRIMVFSSRDDHNVGGQDLWYSVFSDNAWSKPVNIGRRINTRGDEFAPLIYRGFLIFASNGRDGQTKLYSTRLIADRITGDTVGMIQIGRSPVHALPDPINSKKGENFCLAVDTKAHCGYWVSTRDGEQRLYAFSGSLDGVVVHGVVKNKSGQTLSGVKITVGTLSTTTDEEGRYCIYLPYAKEYTVNYRIDDYFSLDEVITTPPSTAERLVTDTKRETVMERLPIDQRIVYNDLFGPNADIELSDYGKQQLRQLVRFLNDNQYFNVTLRLACHLTPDESYNKLLARQRLQSIQNHLYSQVSSSVKMNFAVGDTSPGGSKAGPTRLAVVISKK